MIKNAYYLFIYNNETGEKYLLDSTSKENGQIPTFFTIEDNALTALIQPYDLYKYIDTNLVEDKRLLSEIEKNQDEDNPIIVKYHLK